MGQAPRDVDGTPRWRELLPSLLAMLDTPKRNDAIDHLTAMANAADGYVRQPVGG